MNHISKLQTVVSWTLQLVVAGILLQTLFFKFTGAEESVYIFSTLGAEPWGRIGSGVVELVAAVLLLVPATSPLGALMRSEERRVGKGGRARWAAARGRERKAGA